MREHIAEKSLGVIVVFLLMFVFAAYTVEFTVDPITGNSIWGECSISGRTHGNERDNRTGIH